MRVFRVSIALWYDPNWRACFRRSWKQRRYWLAKPDLIAIAGHPLALQFGPITLKFIMEGRDHG
jgi:hypothetical protein